MDFAQFTARLTPCPLKQRRSTHHDKFHAQSPAVRVFRSFDELDAVHPGVCRGGKRAGEARCSGPCGAVQGREPSHRGPGDRSAGEDDARREDRADRRWVGKPPRGDRPDGHLYDRGGAQDHPGRVGRGVEVHAAQGGDSAQWSAEVPVGEDAAGHSGAVSGRRAARVHGIRQHQLSAGFGTGRDLGSGAGEAGVYGGGRRGRFARGGTTVFAGAGHCARSTLGTHGRDLWRRSLPGIRRW